MTKVRMVKHVTGHSQGDLICDSFDAQCGDIQMWISEGMPEVTEILARLMQRNDIAEWFAALAADPNPNVVDAAKCSLLIGYALGKTDL